MPKVPQYQESQRLGNAPDARFSVNGRALSLTLGGETWGAVDRAGRQMRATGEQMGGIALDLMREHNETVALDRLNKAEAAILDMQTEQGKRLGGNALDSEDGKSVGVTGTLRAGLDKLRGELTQGMNPAQKKLFDDVFIPRGRSVLRWGASFEAQQREVFTTSTEDGKLAVDAQRALANYGDREQVDAALGNTLFVLERRGKRLGLAPEAVQAQRTEAAHKLLLPVFDAMLDKGELAQARQYVQAYGGILGAGTAAAVQAKIRARADALQAKAEAERKKALDAEIQNAGAALVRAVNLLPPEDAAGRERLLVELAAGIQDPVLRGKALAGADRELAFNKRMAEVRQDAVTAEFNTPEVRNLSPLEQTARLNQYLDEGRITRKTYDALNKSINGGPAFTVPAAYNTYMDMATGTREDGTPWFDSETALRTAMTEADTLTLADQDKIVSAFQAGRNATSAASAAAYKDARASLLKNLEALGVDEEKTYQAQIYLDQVFGEFRETNKRYPTAREMAGMALAATKKVWTGRKKFAGAREEMPLYEAMALVPVEARRELRAELIRQGWSPEEMTEEMLLQEYNRNDNEAMRQELLKSGDLGGPAGIAGGI